MRGSEFDRWDLEVRGGMFGSARLAMAVEPHGSGRQLLRIRCWPRCGWSAFVLVMVLGGLALGALLEGAWAVGVILDGSILLLTLRISHECSFGTGAFLSAVKEIERMEKVPGAKANGQIAKGNGEFAKGELLRVGSSISCNEYKAA